MQKTVGHTQCILVYQRSTAKKNKLNVNSLITFEMAKAQKGSSKSGEKRVGMLDSCDY